jgi:ribosomal protein S18 acetylase RimI-like enzyme
MTNAPRSRVTIEEAVSLGDYMFLRRLRNQVRHFMTNDTEPISYFRQFRFFLAMKVKSQSVASFRIFVATCGPRPVGYLLTRTIDGIAYITEAVDPSFRRQGIGKQLVAFAQDRHAEIVAEIRTENEPSIALHHAMGFVLEGQRNGLEIYRYRR